MRMLTSSDSNSLDNASTGATTAGNNLFNFNQDEDEDDANESFEDDDNLD